MEKLHYSRADYSVVVKNRAPPPKCWRWAIYRAGNARPIKQSPAYFDAATVASQAGKLALDQLLAKLFLWCYLSVGLRADSFPRLLSISFPTDWPSFRVLRPACATAEMWTNSSLPA